jgi:DNA recombination-dependent growth factor C
MWFKNLQIYRLPAPWAKTAEALAQALAPHEFTPCTSADMLQQGWIAPRPAGDLVHAVGGQFLLMLKTEKKLLPPAVINQVAAARAIELEEAQGFALGKKAMKELKERVADELLPRAFSLASTTAVWIDPINGWLVVDAASPAKADEVIKHLLKAVDRLPLESLRVQRSPTAVMTEWLETGEAPAGFTVDMDATLCATGESRAQIAYKKHTLEVDDVRKHIAAGKKVTKLAMTWNDRISFVLTETLAIKTIKPLDVIKETESSIKNDEERFDADMALMTGELAKMLADVVEALGGEATVSEPGEPAAPRAAAPGQRQIERAVRMTAEMYKVRDMHRSVLNELYDQTIQPVIKEVRGHMAANKIGAIESAIHMAKALPAGSQSAQLLLVAAVEIVEPGPATAAGSGRAREVLAQLGAGGAA